MVEAIQVPFIYKYGAEKGRIQIFIAIAIMAFLIGGIVWIDEKFSVNLFTNPILTILSDFLPIFLIIATIILYFVSYKIAYKIYVKKER